MLPVHALYSSIDNFQWNHDGVDGSCVGLNVSLMIYFFLLFYANRKVACVYGTSVPNEYHVSS
jgi:hypothetical protein